MIGMTTNQTDPALVRLWVAANYSEESKRLVAEGAEATPEDQAKWREAVTSGQLSPKQFPHSSAEFRKLLTYGLDLADAHGITLVSIQAANFGGLDLHVNSIAEADVLGDALGLRPDPSPEGTEGIYRRDGLLSDVLALPTLVGVYSGRK